MDSGLFIADEFLVGFHAVCNVRKEIPISGSCVWETSSVFFDTVKIYRCRVCFKGDTGLAGLAFIPMVKYVGRVVK